MSAVDRLRAAGCVFAEDEARLLSEAAVTPAEFERNLARRVAGEPLEQVLGWVEFCGLRIGVTAGVFVPRQRTALLVRAAAELTPPGSTVLDLCCGSGALGIALRAAVGPLELHAVDVEASAVACARANLGATATVYRGDLFAPLPPHLRGRVSTVLANVPYVPSAAIATLPPEAREHEPHATLDGGPDGLDVLRRVAADAPAWLAPGGHLLVETSAGQALAAADAFAAAGLEPRTVSDDEVGATVLIGRRRAHA